MKKTTPLARLLTIVVLALLLNACQHQPITEPVEKQIQAANSAVDQTITVDKMMADIEVLSSDQFAGRAPGTAGGKLTMDFIEKKYRDAGLQPMFGDSFRQKVSMVSITAKPETIRISISQDQNRKKLKYGPEIMLGTSQVVDSVSVLSSQVIFVGYGIIAPEYEWDDYKGIDVKGKTVMVLINDPGFATQDPNLFNGNAMTYYGRWSYKFEEAARQGATGIIIIHETAPAAYPWKVVESSGSGPQLVLDSANGNMDRLVFESWVTRDIAAEMINSSGQNFEELKLEALSNDFEAIPLSWNISVHLQNSLKKSISYNIGGIVPGRTKADELFFYMGHWDHLGTDASITDGSDNIYNGAVDNASGIAALIALANTFGQLAEAPARSVGFLAVTAEESGLLGSGFYAANPAFALNKTVGGINMDALSVYGPTEDVVVVGYGSSSLEEQLKIAAQSQNRLVEPEPTPEKGFFYRSDHFNFAKRGVPVLYAKGGVKHREKGEQWMRDINAYHIANRYHAPGDEINEDWDLRGMVEDVKLFFNIGEHFANSSETPYWYEGNEFKAIRDASLAE